jgi:hypothetical protein
MNPPTQDNSSLGVKTNNAAAVLAQINSKNRDLHVAPLLRLPP